ncbi:MAG: N-acetylmuramoyl-L-alanine amidase [Actinomycetota bacterium]
MCSEASGRRLLGAPLSRRAVLASVLASTGLLPPAGTSGRPAIRPRSAWAGATCPVRAAMPSEAPGNVRVLLVHHSETGNSYGSMQVPAILRSFYRYHVGKGWPDIAYNFLVDRYGGIWEGRAGSLAQPVMPSATGGSQGYSQIACWVGNHRATAPTAAAQRSMISLLAWLAKRYVIDTAPGATTSFVSRGSSKWPRRAPVTTRTIEGHRSMSSTTDCPGDAAYAIVKRTFQRDVSRAMTGWT